MHVQPRASLHACLLDVALQSAAKCFTRCGSSGSRCHHDDFRMMINARHACLNVPRYPQVLQVTCYERVWLHMGPVTILDGMSHAK
jgi:hypothetical protein